MFIDYRQEKNTVKKILPLILTTQTRENIKLAVGADIDEKYLESKLINYIDLIKDLYDARYKDCGYWGYIDDYVNEILVRINIEYFLYLFSLVGEEKLSQFIKKLDKLFFYNTIKIDTDVVSATGIEDLIKMSNKWRKESALLEMTHRIPYNIDEDFKSTLGEYKIIPD